MKTELVEQMHFLNFYVSRGRLVQRGF